MSVVLTIKESPYGLWRICSGSDVLFDKLRFAHAIRLGRGLAREEHDSSGESARVEMICNDFSIPLVQYAGIPRPRAVAAS